MLAYFQRGGKSPITGKIKVRYHARSAVLLVILVLFIVSARVFASAISYGYKSKDKISYGSLVSVSDEDQNMVKLATKEDIDNLLGIAVNSDDSLLSLSNGVTDVEVVLEGQTTAVVSDINGEIKPGDPITISPITGVGMKSPNYTKVVGVAQQAFSSKNSGVVTQKVKDKLGKDVDVAIGKISVTVKVENFNSNQGPTSAFLFAIQNAVSFFAGRQVSVARAMVAATIVFSALLICSVIVYTSVRSSFISVGRNPLAQGSIRKNLYVILVTVLSILGTAFVGAYLVVR